MSKIKHVTVKHTSCQSLECSLYQTFTVWAKFPRVHYITFCVFFCVNWVLTTSVYIVWWIDPMSVYASVSAVILYVVLHFTSAAAITASVVLSAGALYCVITVMQVGKYTFTPTYCFQLYTSDHSIRCALDLKDANTEFLKHNTFWVILFSFVCPAYRIPFAWPNHFHAKNKQKLILI